jgi:nucleotide-binding universal stress UspA family protein
MLLHLFPEAFPREVVAANYRYYEPITDHGSSLSPAIHAAVAARLGLRDDAERYWRESLWLDLSNTMGNSALGVHPACMGATWQALVFGFLGVRFTETGPVPDPDAGSRLPGKWRGGRAQRSLARRPAPGEVARKEIHERLFRPSWCRSTARHIAAQSLGCATWLASRLGARLHMLSATAQELPAREELVAPQGPRGALAAGHAASGAGVSRGGDPGGRRAPRGAARRHDRARRERGSIGGTNRRRSRCGQSGGARGARGHRAQRGAGAAAAAAYREALPWERALVPVSGETEVDEALALAVRLANALDLEVHVAHVADPDTATRASRPGALRRRPASRVSAPARGVRQPRPAPVRPGGMPRIVDIALCHGDVVTPSCSLIERKRISLIVVGWHGRFLTGRARSALQNTLRKRRGTRGWLNACGNFSAQPAASRPTAGWMVGKAAIKRTRHVRLGAERAWPEAGRDPPIRRTRRLNAVAPAIARAGILHTARPGDTPCESMTS